MRPLLGLLVCLTLFGCAAGSISPTQLTSDSPRQLTFQFRNDSSEEAHILITRLSDNTLVGSSLPAVIPPHSRNPVTIAVPEDDDWALYVEPALSDMGPLLFGSEVSGCRGAISLEINVDSNGNPERSSATALC